MAVDEALLRSVAEGAAPPTLRLYGWMPPALTLGRGQPVADADLDALAADGIALVRRATGGTAVLNRDVFSYSVTVPVGDPRFAGSIAESYHGVSLALLAALQSLGLRGAEARANPEARTLRARERSVVCFELPSDYEITVGGRKLFGSSQMRSRGSILQHGTLVLAGDMGDISRYLASRPDPAHIRSVTATLQAVLGRSVPWEEVAAAAVAAFAAALNLELLEGALLPAERLHVESLLAQKYAADAWTHRL